MQNLEQVVREIELIEEDIVFIRQHWFEGSITTAAVTGGSPVASPASSSTSSSVSSSVPGNNPASSAAKIKVRDSKKRRLLQLAIIRLRADWYVSRYLSHFNLFHVAELMDIRLHFLDCVQSLLQFVVQAFSDRASKELVTSELGLVLVTARFFRKKVLAIDSCESLLF